MIVEPFFRLTSIAASRQLESTRQTALPTDNHRREFGKRIAIVGYNFLKAGELTRVFLNLPLSDDVKNEKFVDSESKVRASEIFEGKEHPDCAQTPELCVRTAECYDVQAFGLNEFGECREAIVDEKNPANSRPGGCGQRIAPSAMGQDVTVIVKRGTQVSNYNFYVKYRSPTIDSITISADSSPLGLIPTVGLEEITITGENFGNGKATVALGTVAPVSASGCTCGDDASGYGNGLQCGFHFSPETLRQACYLPSAVANGHPRFG